MITSLGKYTKHDQHRLGDQWKDLSNDRSAGFQLAGADPHNDPLLPIHEKYISSTHEDISFFQMTRTGDFGFESANRNIINWFLSASRLGSFRSLSFDCIKAKAKLANISLAISNPNDKFNSIQNII